MMGLDIEEGKKYKGKIKVAELEDGSEVEIPYFVMRGVKKHPVLLLNAAIHGDELNGVEVIMRLFEELNPMQIKGTIIGVPVVNVLAFRSRDRFDAIEKRDLNRKFPGKKNGNITEKIAYHFFNEFVKNADFGIDLHAGMKGHLLLPHGRARILKDYKPNLEYYQALGTDIIFYHEGEKGMLNIMAGKEGIPIVCFEIGEADRLDEYYINEGIKAVKNFMRYFGMLDGLPEMPARQILLQGYIEVRANAGGIFYSGIKVGDVVKEGDIIGYIRKINGERVYLKAEKDSTVMGVRTLSAVREGDPIAWMLSFENAEILEIKKKVKTRRNKILEKAEKFIR